MATMTANDEDIPFVPASTHTTEVIISSTSTLSADTLAALGDFYSEREQNEKRLEDLKAHMEQQQPQAPLSMNMFLEDWNASQFWVRCRAVVLLWALLMLLVQRRNGRSTGAAAS